MSEAPQLEKHEDSDIQVRPVLAVGCGLVVALVLILGLMAALTSFFGAMNGNVLTEPTTPLPTPQPGLQAAPEQDLLAVQATQEAQLNGYGWVNQAAGVAHIPIDRAMSILLEQGLPTPVPTPTEEVGQ